MRHFYYLGERGVLKNTFFAPKCLMPTHFFSTARHPEFYSGITNAQWLFLSEYLKEVVTPNMIREGVEPQKPQPSHKKKTDRAQLKRKRCWICPSQQ